VHAYLDVVAEVEPELVKDASRVGHGTRAIAEALVPVGRRSEQRTRVAGAESANNEVVDALSVLEGLDYGRRPRIKVELESSCPSVEK
jgi:hypothetical protein